MILCWQFYSASVALLVNMNRMKILVGLLMIMILGSIFGTGVWNWNLSSDMQDIDTDSAKMKIVSNNYALEDMEGREEDYDTIMSEENVSPIITTAEKPIKSFYRYKKERNANFCNKFRFRFSVDFPRRTSKNMQSVRAWLAEKAVKSLSRDISYKEKKYSDQQIEKYTSNLFFSFKQEEYATVDTTCYPIEVFFELSMHARVINKRFVTYQQCTNEYEGGIHGYYTERLVSYDHVHCQEIDCGYLFVEHSTDQVVNALVCEAKNNQNYREWKPNIRNYIYEKNEEGKLTGKINLPQPGLTEKGIVFSFQPYEISCFAAGTFHFTIPYERLKPYLTEKAKWCLDMK